MFQKLSGPAFDVYQQHHRNLSICSTHSHGSSASILPLKSEEAEEQAASEAMEQFLHLDIPTVNALESVHLGETPTSGASSLLFDTPCTADEDSEEDSGDVFEEPQDLHCHWHDCENVYEDQASLVSHISVDHIGVSFLQTI